MQQQNISDYKLARKELLNIKNCMTTYIGFVLGGSGAALFGLGVISNNVISNNTNKFISLSITPLLLSLIVLYVLSVLLYKFNSHNRISGYCKLLSHERYNNTLKETISFSWEICLDELRYSDISKKNLIKLCGNLKVKGIRKKRLKSAIKKVTGNKPSIDKKRAIRGFKILLLSFVDNLKTDSWSYPIFIISVFFSICLLFLIIGCIFSYLYSNEIVLVIMGIILLIHLFKWYIYSKKIFSLIEGSATINSFFLRFLPVRITFLNKHGIIPEYILTESIFNKYKS